jgi:hypothetical protein
VTAKLGSLEAKHVYHFRIVATTAGGTQAGADLTFTTAAPSPHLSALRISPNRFRAFVKTAHGHRPAKTGATVHYNDSQPATTTLTVLQAQRGVRSGRRCVAPPRHPRGKAKPRRCTRLVALGSFSHRDRRAGAQTLHYDGRAHGRALAPGSYTLTAAAIDGAQQRSNTIQTGFRIVH